MFKDREEAALVLSRKILKVIKEKNVVVLGLTRGGAVVAKIISGFLEVPFDILVVKKIGAPHNPELAIGAVAPWSTVYWNKDLIKSFKLSNEDKQHLKEEKEKERSVQELVLRQKSKPLDFTGKTVILVDDGVATGATVIAASKYLKKGNAKKIILAVPVISKDSLLDIKNYFDMVISLLTKRNFVAVAQFYDYFPQVTNEEVQKLL